MIFTELLNAVADRLRETMPRQVHVDTHPGELDSAELKRLCVRTPALRVVFAGVRGVDSARGAVAAEVALGVFVICGPRKGEPQPDIVSLALVPRVLATVYGENWGIDAVESTPQALKAENLFTGLDAANFVSLWAVSWRQRIELPSLIAFPPPDPVSGQEVLPRPWNDPLEDFLRMGLNMHDERGESVSNDVIAVREPDHE